MGVLAILKYVGGFLLNPRVVLYGLLSLGAATGVGYIYHKGTSHERAKQERTEVKLQEQGDEARREAERAVARGKSGGGLLPVRKDPYQRD